MNEDKPKIEYKSGIWQANICHHCGAIHDNEFSLTCADCDHKRESGELEIEATL